MNEAAPTWTANPRRTQVVLPAGTIDCHCHVFGPTDCFPYDPASGCMPGDAP